MRVSTPVRATGVQTLWRPDDWNATFYGKKALPTDIFVRMVVQNKAADKLLAQVTAAAKKK